MKALKSTSGINPHPPAGLKPAGGSVDLTPYAGRWVAIIRGRVSGVGRTADEARRLAKRNRPKEEPEVLFVPPRKTDGDDEQGEP